MYWLLAFDAETFNLIPDGPYETKEARRAAAEEFRGAKTGGDRLFWLDTTESGNIQVGRFREGRED